MAKTIVKNSEIKKYQLSEKNRQAILASNPFPSVLKIIETQRAAFKTKYKLSEKNRRAILAPNPFPSVWEVIEKQRAAFKAMYGDYWGQQPVKMMGGRS